MDMRREMKMGDGYVDCERDEDGKGDWGLLVRFRRRWICTVDCERDEDGKGDWGLLVRFRRRWICRL
jgi:hypothetical protein